MSFKRASVNDIKRAFERIKDKFLTLSKVAFSGKYIDLTGTPELGSSAYANIVDNRTTNVKGFVPDATQLAEMQAEIDKLNSTLENRFVYVREGSTISFADAFSKTDTVFGNMSLALDALETNISNYENGIHSVAGSTQNFFVVLCKRTGNTYAGIIMTYLGYNPVFFSRSTGGFSIFFPTKAN